MCNSPAYWPWSGELNFAYCQEPIARISTGLKIPWDEGTDGKHWLFGLQWDRAAPSLKCFQEEKIAQGENSWELT